MSRSIEIDSAGQFDIGGVAKKAVVIGGGAFIAGTIYIAGREVLKIAQPIVGAVKRFDLDWQTRRIKREALNLGLDPEKIQDLTILVGGDSQLKKDGLPGDEDALNPRGSLDEAARRLIRGRFGIHVDTHNCARPGHTVEETREEIKNGKLGKLLRLTNGNVILVLGVHGNNWRGFIKDKKVARQIDDIRQKITLKTGISLSRRHNSIDSEFETEYVSMLHDVDEANQDRVNKGLNPLMGLCLYMPTDFGDASSISFVPMQTASSEVNEDSFDPSHNEVVRNIATLVAYTVTRGIRRAHDKFAKKRNSDYPIALIPMHKKIKPKHYTYGQHTGLEAQVIYGDSLVKTIFKPAA